jgi:hypothetical protein
MLTRDQLDQLEEVLEALVEGKVPSTNPDQIKDLLKSTRAMQWATSKQLSKKERELIAEAERAGRVKVATPYVPVSPQRVVTKPKPVLGSGTDVLKALGLLDD